MRLSRLLLLAMSMSPSGAEERWLSLAYGPLEVVTDGGEREGRETLMQLVQFRHALATVLGKKDLVSTWPVRVLVFKSPRQGAIYGTQGLQLAPDAWTGAVSVKEPVPPPVFADLARLLIGCNAGRLPRDLERGLVELFSTLEVSGPHITLGKPPAQRDREWAKVHMLAVRSDTYGLLRVLIHNLEQNVEPEVAYRNAFGKPLAAVDKEAESYWSAGQFATAPISSLRVFPDKEFSTKPVTAVAAQAFLAGLLFTNPARAAAARSAYNAIRNSFPAAPEATEGLGLLALREHRTQEAREILAEAIEKGAGARACYEYAGVEPDGAKARAALEKAAKLNPRWAAPPFALARRETDPEKKAALLAAAANLEPDNSGYWQALARELEAQDKYPEAARAWASAERAAADDAERGKLGKMREEVHQRRIEFEAAERERREAERQRELTRLKEQSAASIQAALAKANQGMPPADPNRKVYQWWDGPTPDAKLQGVLQKVDCLGSRLRLVIAGEDKRVTQLLIRDPKQVVVPGGGDVALACGPQRPPRKVVIEYFRKPDSKLGTAGEAAVLQFP